MGGYMYEKPEVISGILWEHLFYFERKGEVELV